MSETQKPVTDHLAAGVLPGNALPQQTDLVSDQSASTEVSTLGPIMEAAAGATPYEGTAEPGLSIPESVDQASQAEQYLASLFPESRFTYLGSGRYGLALADDTGKVFKVYRDALRYSRYEQEAGALQVLSQAGLAPKLHVLVDADEKYRLDRKAHDYVRHGFGNVQIPRANSGRELPVLIMDKVDVAPLETAAPDKLAAGFCRAAELFIRENIEAWDSEVVVNAQTGNVTFLDVGELAQVPYDTASASPEDKMKHELAIIRSLTIDFGLSKDERQIASTYRQEGLEGVRRLVMTLRPSSAAY